MLHLNAVSRRFASGVLALDGLSCSIERGSFVSLLGPSGCGKSTALRLMAGLTPPDAGSITWDGGKPELGFVFQDAALLPWLRVGRNVSLPLDLAGLDAASVRDRVAAALDTVGLGGFATAFPRELSGGMRMRVSIARALAAGAPVLLMDEPFAALDEPTRERLNDELRSIWKQRGLTIIFVTHSVYESVYLSSRVLVMSARPGRIVADVRMEDPVARDPDFRTTPAYGERCRILRAALHASEAA